MNTNTFLVILLFIAVTMGSPLSVKSTLPSNNQRENVLHQSAPWIEKDFNNIEGSDVKQLKSEITRLLNHVIGKRSVYYDTIAGSTEFLSSNEAGNIQRRIERLRQLQRLESKHRRFHHGVPLSIELALPVLSRNYINTPSTTPNKR